MGVIYIEYGNGCLKVEGTEERVTRIEFSEGKGRESTDPYLESVRKELIEYFEGKRKEFSIEILLEGTEFQKSVWKELIKIPYGEVATYGEIAKRIGNPKGSRAVGMACNRNKLPIIVPCHRVIGSNGKLTGFAGGLGVKNYLLDMEKKHKGEDNV